MMKQLLFASLFAASLFAGELSQRIKANGLDVLIVSNLGSGLSLPGRAAPDGEQMVQIVTTAPPDADVIGWTVKYDAVLADGSIRPVTLLLPMDPDGIVGTFINLGKVITGVNNLDISPILVQPAVLRAK